MNYFPPHQRQQPMGFQVNANNHVGAKKNFTDPSTITSSKTTLAKSDSESSPYHKKKQIQYQKKDKSHRDDIMIPSISKYRSCCSPNIRNSPSSIKKMSIDISLSNENKNMMKKDANDDDGNKNKNSSNIIVIDLPSLELNYESEPGSSSSSSSEEDINKYDYHQQQQQQQQHHPTLQQQGDEFECYDKYGYEECYPDNTIIVDDVDDDEEEGDEKENEDRDKYEYGDDNTNKKGEEIPSSCYSPRNEFSSAAFCPKRLPRRSSMKGSSEISSNDESGSNSSRRRASIGVTSSIEVLLPGRRDPVKRRRSITFDNDVNVQKIVPVQFMAKDGPKELWFQENEYETIKIKTLALLDRVGDHNSSGVVNGKKYCTRGLEKFMTPEATEVKKHQAWDSVLNEQFLQRKDGEYDEETLANIYKYSTKRSQSEASKRANQDAAAAEAYLKTTFEMKSSFEEWKARTGYNRRMSM